MSQKYQRSNLMHSINGWMKLYLWTKYYWINTWKHRTDNLWAYFSWLSVFFFLNYVDENCDLEVVQECYKKLHELLAWGYPFTLIRINKSCMHVEYLDYINQMVKKLSKNNLEGFVDVWKELMLREEKLATANTLIR